MLVHALWIVDSRQIRTESNENYEKSEWFLSE